MSEIKETAAVQTEQPKERKKIVFSAIQPTGVFTLGNYMGAIKNWIPMQDEYNCLFAVADLHSLTVRQDPIKLRERIMESYALLMACGIDPKKSVLFLQSHVSQHAELSWILNCNTQFGELSRMTQFKDKSAKHADNVNAGLFDYPVLMAADILLYQTDLVPVGVDQKQHLELSRDIANRFNTQYGNTLRVPEPYIMQRGAKIMSLADPTKKMSKSDENKNATITILDTEAQIINKCKRAVTDSEMEIAYREGKDGVNNLMTLYSLATGLDFSQIEHDFAGKGYGDFKLAVGEAVAEMLRPIRENFALYSKDRAYLETCMKEGAETASRLASRTLEKVYKKVGLVKRG